MQEAYNAMELQLVQAGYTGYGTVHCVAQQGTVL